MTPFMTEDFLLDTEFARRLYHDYAKDQPIFDYHCHLPPQQIAALAQTGAGAQAVHTLLAVGARPDAEIMALEAHALPINTDR